MASLSVQLQGEDPKLVQIMYNVRKCTKLGFILLDDEILKFNSLNMSHRELFGLDQKKIKSLSSNNVFLKVSPTKTMMRFGRNKKLSTRYMRPFEISEKIFNDLAYVGN